MPLSLKTIFSNDFFIITHTHSPDFEIHLENAGGVNSEKGVEGSLSKNWHKEGEFIHSFWKETQ